MGPDTADPAETGRVAGVGPGLALTDSHCHLDQLPDPAAALDQAAAAGVGRLAAVAEDGASMDAVLDLKERFPGRVLAGLGVHPVEVTRRPASDIDADLQHLASRLDRADLVGEIGLDHKWATETAERARQEEVLERQLDLAREHGLPVNLHSRRCPRQVMERAIAFVRSTGLGAQLHWFTHSRKLVRQANEAGVYVSVGPTVLTDSQAQAVALSIADDLLLVETDAPVPMAGRPGHPRCSRDVAEKLAALKGVSCQEVAARTEANYRHYLGR